MSGRRLTEAHVVCSAVGPGGRGSFGALIYYVGLRPWISCATVIHSPANGATWCEDPHRGRRDCSHVRAVLEYRAKWGERKRYREGAEPK